MTAEVVSAAPEVLRVYTAPGEAADLQEMLGEGGVEFAEISHIDELRAAADPAVLFLSRGLLGGGGALDAIAMLPAHIVVVAADDGARSAATQAGRLFLAAPELAPGEGPLTRALRSAGRHAEAEGARAAMGGSADLARRRLADVNRIGMSLMGERDLDTLLEMILTHARRLTTSDAGSLYLVESGPVESGPVKPGPVESGNAESGAPDAEGAARLRFLLAQNDTLPDLPDPDFTLPISQESIAGYAAATGETLVIDDAYDLPEGAPWGFDASFDERHGYRARSMLVVPMIDHRTRVVGVLQLINRKRDAAAPVRSAADADAHVVRFGRDDVELVQSLAGQAAVAIENGQLHRSIEGLFEGLVRATVTAIDQRDPTTSGHSVRVTELTCAVAERMDGLDDGPFADVTFSEADLRQLRYAGMLHDVGKIGVPEEVLVKPRKLTAVLEERVKGRLALIRRSIEGGFGDESGGDLADLEAALEAVARANEPAPMDEATAEILDAMTRRTFRDVDGEARPWLTDEEHRLLSIERGTLDARERALIEAHVDQSCDFLREVPWTDDLGRISTIVRGHHERLDGKGYPDGVRAESIPLETRIMSVCDVFDAITASDRPYRQAMPTDRAFAVLRAKAEEGALDPDVVELFIESGLWTRVLGMDWREL